MRYFIHSIAAATLLSTPAAVTAQNQSDGSSNGQRQRTSQADTYTEREATSTERDERQRAARRRRSRSAEQQTSQREQRLRAGQSRSRRSAGRRSGPDARQARGVRLSPSGWVRVATDYDNDGRFDAIETLFVYDLETARERSRARADQEMRGEQRQMNRRQEGAGEDRGRVARRQQPRRGEEQARSGRGIRAEVASMKSRRGDGQRQAQLEGEIEQLREESLAGMDGAYWIARVRTDQGRTAKVLLGSKADLRSLQLSDGDQIRVTGKHGRINDKAMLIAETVRSGGDEVSVDLPSSRALKRVRGEVLRKRTANFRGFDQPHVVAQVELVNGKQQTVNLGPQEKVRSLNLREGDRVSLLVRPGKVNGSPAMIAEQIRSGGKTVRLPRPEDSQRFRGAQREDRNGQDRRS